MRLVDRSWFVVRKNRAALSIRGIESIVLFPLTHASCGYARFELHAPFPSTITLTLAEKNFLVLKATHESTNEWTPNEKLGLRNADSYCLYTEGFDWLWEAHRR